jgi:hypothetical protein
LRRRPIKLGFLPMDLTEFLRRNGLTQNDLSVRAAKDLGRGEQDILFVSGSLVEGFGNASSDIDLYLVTGRRDVAPTLLNTHVILIGTIAVDVTICGREALEALLSRFELYSSKLRDPKEAFAFSRSDRQMLHRLLVGQPLWNGDAFQMLAVRINRLALSRHKLNCALHSAKCLQLDLSGCRAAGDWCTMLLAGQQLLDHTIDGLLAGYLETNNVEKWRTRILQRLPPDWEDRLPGRSSQESAIQLYFGLKRLPGALNSSTALEHALRIVAFSRRVFSWAGWVLSHPGVEAEFVPYELPIDKKVKTLFHLDLDVVFVYSDGRFQARRISTGEKSVGLSPAVLSILCLFDGETSEAEVILALASRYQNATSLLEDIYSLISFFDLRAKEVLDEDLLAKVLTSSL